MLENLQLTNFKSWERADLRFGRITGLFGTNSSGKSSLLQFLLLLKQTKEATDRAIALNFQGSFADVGTFQDVVFSGDLAREISWNLKYNLTQELVLSAPDDTGNKAIASGSEVSIFSGIREAKLGVISTSLRYSLGGQSFELVPSPEKPSSYLLKTNSKVFRFKRTIGRKWPIPRPVKSYAFPDQVKSYHQNAGFLSDLEKSYEEQVDKMFYLGPLRDYPKRQYLLADTQPRDVGLKGENTISAIRAMTTSGEKRNLSKGQRLRPFQELIAHWLRELGLVASFRVEEIKKGTNLWQVFVRVREGAAEVLLTDVGFGISQVLPVLTLLQYVPEGSTVILEQPEIHLHPLAQAKLADAIVSAAQHRNLQVIVESHSEHLLLRLQRRVAEEVLSSSDVKLYFCDASKNKSNLVPLEMDMFGKILNWPDKFMGDQFGETASAEMARLSRMI